MAQFDSSWERCGEIRHGEQVEPPSKLKSSGGSNLSYFPKPLHHYSFPDYNI